MLSFSGLGREGRNSYSIFFRLLNSRFGEPSLPSCGFQPGLKLSSHEALYNGEVGTHMTKITSEIKANPLCLRMVVQRSALVIPGQGLDLVEMWNQ